MPESTTRPIIIKISCLLLPQVLAIDEVISLTSKGCDFTAQFRNIGELFISEDQDSDFAHNLQFIRDQITKTGFHAYIILKFAAQCPNTKIVIRAQQWQILQELNASLLLEVWQNKKLFEDSKFRLVDEQSEDRYVPEEVYASLRIASIDLDPAEITEELRVQTDDAFKKDENHTFGRWSLSTKNKYLGNPSELGEYVTYLVNRTNLNSAHIQHWISAGHDPIFLFFWSAKGQVSRASFRHSDIKLLVSLQLDVVIDCYI